jgi:hypothetical protein
VRDVLGAAWPLFQVSLPACLPLTLIAVAASGSPVADATPLSRTWWGVVLVRAVLVLICYGAMLRQQLGIAAGDRPPVLQSVRNAFRDVPSALLLIAVWILPFVPAAASTALRGFDSLALVLTAGASASLVYVLPAWPEMIAGGLRPWTALANSVRMVRGRWLQFGGVVLTLVGGTLVFALLASIFVNMVMSLSGQGANPTGGALVFSRWLIALVLAVPVVYAGATAVVTWRAAGPTGSRIS